MTRWISGLAVPYESLSRSNKTIFRRGAFKNFLKTLTDVPLLFEHDYNHQIGWTTDIYETDDGLHFEAAIDGTRDNNLLWRKIQSGWLTELSTEWVPIKSYNQWHPVYKRIEVVSVAWLREVSVVTAAAFRTARITGHKIVKE